MMRFCLRPLLFTFLIVLLVAMFAPMRIDAIRTTGFSAPSTATQQLFRPGDQVQYPAVAGGAGFRSEKRRVPTGSNPLHNKRR
ncbi:unnamed protein product [Linum trigynum]|uniref:Uncharacterized protein n=1 Tax=Linum trigynum TaxID=586398 RepID=A0AAV2GA12_9ROSI